MKKLIKILILVILCGTVFLVVTNPLNILRKHKEYLTPNDLFPYSEGEKIHFVNDKGSTLTLSVIKEEKKNNGRYLKINALKGDLVLKEYDINILGNKINIKDKVPEIKGIDLREFIRSNNLTSFLFIYDCDFRITEEIQKGERQKEISENTVFVWDIGGFERITIGQRKELICLKIVENYYFQRWITTPWGVHWWAPGLGLVRWDHYKERHLGGTPLLISRWKVDWESLAKGERIKRYESIIKSIPKRRIQEYTRPRQESFSYDTFLKKRDQNQMSKEE